ncbi:MAG: Bax inhibitor-1/YccA family protein [Endomicrobium sp.]|jgi:uncharacterized YccA/Bax inhibitor family protein|nr:Bax inhibitor-1/YccA family protein [Endomicrobium sp.]
MANPLLREEVFRGYGTQEEMTVSGTINKSIILWLFLAAGAIYSWTNPAVTFPLLWPLIVAGLILVLIMAFKTSASPFLSPIYATAEGLILGVISLYFEKKYPGLVVNAVLLTIAVLFFMLAAYKSGALRATPRFRKNVFIATVAIVIVYMIDLFMNMFLGTNFPYIHDSGLGGICASLFIVSIASFSLITDFDLIEKGAIHGAPKYMEWYGAFVLMVTLVWLYLEILRLLAKMRD